jgi:hypothetical protein
VPFDRHALEILKRQKSLSGTGIFAAAGDLTSGQAFAAPVAARQRAAFRCVLPLTWGGFVPILMSSE